MKRRTDSEARKQIKAGVSRSASLRAKPVVSLAKVSIQDDAKWKEIKDIVKDKHK